MGKYICYVGNWWEADKGFWIAGGKSTTGVCACDYDPASGSLTQFQSTNTEICVGGQCVDAKRGVLYAVDEKLTDPAYRVGGGGAVSAFKIDPETGALTLLNRVSSFGVLTSYVAVDPTSQFLVVTNHTSHNYITRIVKNDEGEYVPVVVHDDATIVLYELNEDGSIGKAVDVYCCYGTGPLGQQTLSHLHSVYFAPLGDFCLICDKGGDLVHTLRIDRDKKKFVPCDEPFHTEAGMMPRYGCFHPTKPFVYTNNEAQPILHCFKYTPDGKLELIETVAGMDKDVPYSGVPYTVKQSDMRISADGRYLYSCVRDVDVISVYSIDLDTGKLKMIQCLRLDVKDPHSCCISPDGKYFLIGALNSHQVVSYPILEDGTLGEKTAACDQPSACSIVFAEI